MKVEILAVGTELLLGQNVNTNAAEIATRLADHGFTHKQQTVVGDNRERMTEAIRGAVDRSDGLIITGGIGPTRDDITREVVAEVAGVPLIFDEEYAEALRDRWERTGRVFAESNLRQAYRPEAAEIIANAKGTAPGFRIDVDGCWVFALPGVPTEMLQMLDGEVVPFLADRAGGEGAVVVSRVIRSWGVSEAAVGEMFEDLFDDSDNPTIAFLASAGTIKVRLTARAGSREEAAALIAPMEQIVRDRLGRHVFGVDDDTIEVVVHRELRHRGWSLGTAESATAGLVASRLASVPGASSTFRGSVIAYAAEVKHDLLRVPEGVLASGVVSEETALAMAEGAREQLAADVAVAVTGSAGPDPLEAQPGTMCLAVVTPERSESRTIRLPGDRERVRTYAATAALHMLRQVLVDE